MRALFFFALRDVRTAFPVGIVLGIIAFAALIDGIFSTNSNDQLSGFGVFIIFGAFCVRFLYRAYRLYTGKALPF